MTSSLALPKRRLLCGLATALAFCGVARAEWPNKPIHLVVPYAAGGGVDNVARIVAPLLAAKLGQPVIIDNKPGANANIGSEFAARAAPDGYTFLIGATFIAVNRAAMTGLGYDAQKDFAPVARLARSPAILIVSAASPVRNVAELVAYANAHPDQASYAVVGSASANNAIFVRNTRIPAVQVLYKGGAQAMPDLIAGRVLFMTTTASEALPLVRSGKLRALAVTGTERMKDLPDVPTMAQAGVPNLTAVGWWGLLAPARTPAAVNEKLAAAILDVVRQPAVVAAMDGLGIVAAPLGVHDFSRFYADELKFYDDATREFDLRQKQELQ
ncbi:Bug family tripartite tricarboxylate transporter substrate binding protein [Xylophilus sp. ASV27]|uniref:Bug family tripartite tricarboxylate transporter substrate binding protein n=1 Tax=Xylophilus sp. ASV27 TaxID=2795129 RepID=UPI0018ED608B|nr:tripartite tricarboxylate transporter substrate-binding protein [Xylophilus sp. ASV27]